MVASYGEGGEGGGDGGGGGETHAIIIPEQQDAGAAENTGQLCNTPNQEQY